MGAFRDGFEQGKQEALAKRARRPRLRDRLLAWLLQRLFPDGF